MCKSFNRGWRCLVLLRQHFLNPVQKSFQLAIILDSLRILKRRHHLCRGDFPPLTLYLKKKKKRKSQNMRLKEISKSEVWSALRAFILFQALRGLSLKGDWHPNDQGVTFFLLICQVFLWKKRTWLKKTHNIWKLNFAKSDKIISDSKNI